MSDHISFLDWCDGNQMGDIRKLEALLSGRKLVVCYWDKSRGERQTLKTMCVASEPITRYPGSSIPYLSC